MKLDKITKSVFLAVILLFTIGCSHTVKRYGYELTETQQEVGDCDPEFYKEMPVDRDKYEVLGRVRLGDSGFSTKCHEDDAVRILKKEACGLNADAVNITDEKRASFISSCYRAEATFLKRKAETVANENKDDAEEEIGGLDEEAYQASTDEISVSQRVASDRQRNAMLSAVGGILGFVMGFMLFGGFN